MAENNAKKEVKPLVVTASFGAYKNLTSSNKIAVPVYFSATRGDNPVVGCEIIKIGCNSRVVKIGTTIMKTDGNGQYTYQCSLPIDETRLYVEYQYRDGKNIVSASAIWDKSKPDKPGWFYVGLGIISAETGLANGKATIKTSFDGPLVTGTLRVRSSRRFRIFGSNNTVQKIVREGNKNKKGQYYEAEILVKNGLWEFQIEKSKEKNHTQQHLFFVLVETGQEIMKLIVIRETYNE